jgi:hypothetical protein
MAIFMQATGHGRYDDFWQWSVDQPEAFWSQLWDFCGAVGEKGSEILVDREQDARRPLVSRSAPELRRKPAAAS